MTLAADLEGIAGRATAHAPGTVSAVLPVEVGAGRRLYVVAYAADDGARTWLVVDGNAAPVADRRDARDAVSVAALCEIAEEAAFPGDLDDLRGQLVALRLTEAPEGIEEAEAAARELQLTLGAPPVVASPARLDAIGHAARRLELALDTAASSPFATAMRSAQGVVDELWREVEASYAIPLGP